MGKDVYANGKEVSGKASDHKCIAAMPDVCLSPPSPPAGPLPIPYPDTSKSADLQGGSKQTKIGAEPICMESQSSYKSSPLGNEASTKTLGANIIDHTNAGKTHCQAFSMDVKVEGKAVTRTLDLTTSNHASTQPGGGAMTPQMGKMTLGSAEVDPDKCPCCHGDLHENQKDPQGNRLPTIKRDDYYLAKKQAVDRKVDGFPAWAAANPTRAMETMTLKFGAPIFDRVTLPAALAAEEERRRAAEIHGRLQAAMSAATDCPNVHTPPDQGCGVHFQTPTDKRTKLKDGKAETKTPAQWARDEVTKGVRNAALDLARKKYPDKKAKITDNDKVNHITPLDAGGCPVAPSNLIPDGALDAKCKEIDDLQTALQGRS